MQQLDILIKKEEAIFLFISLIEPHHQNHTDDYPPPIGYREKYAGRWVPPDLQTLKGNAHQHLAGYFGMTKRIDEAYGRLIDSLLSLKLMDDSVYFLHQIMVIILKHVMKNIKDHVMKAQ